VRTVRLEEVNCQRIYTLTFRGMCVLDVRFPMISTKLNIVNVNEVFFFITKKNFYGESIMSTAWWHIQAFTAAYTGKKQQCWENFVISEARSCHIGIR